MFSMAPPESWGLQLGDCIAGMSEDSRGLLTRTQHLADCTIRTSDGLDFRLHKMKLTEESMVLGCATMAALQFPVDGLWPDRMADRYRRSLFRAVSCSAE